MVFFIFVDEMSLSLWLTLQWQLASYFKIEKKSDKQNILEWWCLSSGSFMINRNKSISLMDSNSTVMGKVSVFQILHNFSNLNLIKYVSCKTFLQKYLNFILFLSDI